jgi:hypothetical protein
MTTTLKILALALGAALVAAPGASADSLVFTRDHNIWLANPDGSGQHQVTLDGTAGSAYGSPSQADDGTIVAVRDRKLYRMTQAGRLLNPPVNTPAPGTGAIDARVSPDGRHVAYWFATAVNSPLCPNCVSAASQALISHSDRFTHFDELGRPHMGGWPSWIGNDTILIGSGSASQWYYKLGWPEAREWFADYRFVQQNFQTLLDAEVARTGDRLVVVRGNSQETLLLLTMNGPPPAQPSLAGHACLGFSQPTGGFNDPTWSNDGLTLAWAEDDGIWVGAVPADLRGCVALPAPALRIPGATEPDFGPAAVAPGPRPGCENPGNPAPCSRPDPPTTPTTPTPTAGTPAARADWLRAALPQRLRVRGGRFTIVADAPASGTLAVELKGTRVLARGRAVVRAAGRTRVTVRLTRAGRAKLRRARSLRATLTATFTPLSGARMHARAAVRLTR